MSKPKVLFCTAAGSLYGIGHLKRCISIIDEAHSSFDSYIFIHKGDKDAVLGRKEYFGDYRFINNIKDAGKIDLIVSDMRETGKREMRRLAYRAPVISIDDLSAGKDHSHVSIYSLPNEQGVSGNFNGPPFIVLNRIITKIPPIPYCRKEGVLVSFGGSDPYNLTGFISSLLNSVGIRPKIIRGLLFFHTARELDGEIIENPQNMYDLINHASILITSFGMTMYEAFFLRTPVILFNHSAYHYRLGNMVPVINLGYRNGLSKGHLRNRLLNILEDEKGLERSAAKNASLIDGKGAGRVVSIINRILCGIRKDCLFDHKKYTALNRNNEYTILQCSKCKDIFLHEIKGLDSIYNDDYFLNEYKNQYGLTYIEDKDNIVKLGLRRIRIIEKIKNEKGKLLDVGCALGYFVELCAQREWKVRGIEISHFACEWGKENLSVDIIQGSFLDIDIKPESYDAVTFFYVAEHFNKIEKVFEKANKILKEKGVIVLALPNRGGISYRFNRKQYIKEHPRDHYLDTSVRNLKKVLKKYGFKKKIIYITGIHPERFFNSIGLKINSRFLNSIYSFYAKIFHLGDTFEYYGIKA